MPGAGYPQLQAQVRALLPSPSSSPSFISTHHLWLFLACLSYSNLQSGGMGGQPVRKALSSPLCYE